MRNIERRIISAAALLLLGRTVSLAQAPAVGSTRITSPRPLADASDLLQHLYGKVVTYEEPVLVWRGELESQAGRDPNRKWGLFPKPQGFLVPSDTSLDPNLASALSKTLDAYHQQTSGTRFQILTSNWGLHIVPVQAHDENGDLVPTGSVLDSRVTVATEERTPEQHLLALLAAATSATGTSIVTGGQGGPGGFDRVFRAAPPRFQWGVDGMVARDALIDLLTRSATTFSWRLKCQASARLEDRFCVLNLAMIEVAVTDAQGQPATRVLKFDRCGDCPPPPPPPPASNPLQR